MMPNIDIHLNIVPLTAAAERAAAERAAAHRWELSTREREMQKLMAEAAKLGHSVRVGQEHYYKAGDRRITI